MLFKLSLSNIRRSLRDYAIYFFTLIIGVSVFYVFNAIGGQAAMLRLDGDARAIVQLLKTLISGVSVFVAGVLGLLIVYASRFLMKRRNKEFALYLILGMGKGRISAILFAETMLIGLGSLAIGLLLGIGLSQIMSALVANLFQADMTAYQFSVSGEAVIKTMLYFAVIYIVVMLFNSVVVAKLKLIDLMQSGKKSEQIRLKNPVLCIVIFIISAAALAYAYYQVGWKYNELDQQKMTAYIAVGCVTTFLIFWSVSGMLLRVIMSMKNAYFRGLNTFTFRQISSKVNTMVFSMTVICLMLFVTICTLSGGFFIRNSMNANLKAYCPADMGISVFIDNSAEELSVTEICEDNGFDVMSYLSDSVHFPTYTNENFTWGSFFGEEMMENFPTLNFSAGEEIVALSDYNAVMRLYGREELSLSEDEFILICNFKQMKEVRNEVLAKNPRIIINGRNLRSKYGVCTDGFIRLSSQPMETGAFIVSDSVVKGLRYSSDNLIGNYRAQTRAEKAETEEIVKNEYNENLLPSFRDMSLIKAYGISLDTRIEISNSAVGLGAIATFLALYIGLVFLIACGAILALKELSESVDSIERYEMLRKIGAEESDISKSLFRQTGIFFLLPLLLAAVHSVFGMKFAAYVLEIFGTENMWESIGATSVIILLIYGGYFLITYYCGKGIIKDKK